MPPSVGLRQVLDGSGFLKKPLKKPLDVGERDVVAAIEPGQLDSTAGRVRSLVQGITTRQIGNSRFNGL